MCFGCCHSGEESIILTGFRDVGFLYGELAVSLGMSFNEFERYILTFFEEKTDIADDLTDEEFELIRKNTGLVTREQIKDVVMALYKEV